MKPKIIVTTLALALLTPQLRADTHTWQGGANGLWSDAHNWVLNAAPAVGETAPVVLRFPVGAPLASTNDVGDIVVDTLRVDAVGYSIELGGVILAGDVFASSAAPGTIQFTHKAELKGGVTFDVGKDVTLAVATTLGGAGGIVKTGDGTLALQANNDFTDDVKIAVGTVLVTSQTGLGDPAAGTGVVAGGALSLANVDVPNESLSLEGKGPSGVGALVTSGLVTWTGPVTISDDATIHVSAIADELTLSGPLAGANVLTKTGRGKLLFAGTAANVNTGAIEMHDGELVLSKSSSGVAATGGAIFVGDGNGGPNATLRNAQSEQIPDQLGVTIRSNGNYRVGGFSETIGPLAGSGKLDLTLSTLYVGRGDATSEFAGDISGNGPTNLVKIANGTLALSGTNTHTGMTEVQRGTLLVNGAQLSSFVQVQGGATLGGRGVLGPAAVAPAGRVAPGNSPGLLRVSSIPFSAGSFFVVDLEGTGPGQFDTLEVGNVNLAGATLQLNLSYAPMIGDAFIIVNKTTPGPVAGTFAGLPDGTKFTMGGHGYQITYLGGDGNDVLVRVIPDPAAAVFDFILYLSGEAKLHGTGTPGFLYKVEATQSLTPPIQWTQIGDSVANPFGILAFTDLDAALYPARFYRFVLP